MKACTYPHLTTIKDKSIIMEAMLSQGNMELQKEILIVQESLWAVRLLLGNTLYSIFFMRERKPTNWKLELKPSIFHD